MKNLRPKVDPLNQHELDIVQYAYTGLKNLKGYKLMRVTEYHAWIETPLNGHITSFLLLEDEDGKEYVLIGNEHIPLEHITKHKNYGH